VVEMAKGPHCALGATLETKVCSKHKCRQTHPSQRPDSGIQHLEHSLEKQRDGSKTCLLGDLEWRKCTFLAGLVATKKISRSDRGAKPPQATSSHGHPSACKGILATEKQPSTLATMEDFNPGATDPRELGPLHLVALCHPQGKSPSEKARTFLDGGTPLQVTFQSNKPTIYKVITRVMTRRISGTRFGAPSSRRRCQPFFVSPSTTISSLGIMSRKEASLDHQSVPYANNKRKLWNISSTYVLSTNGYGPCYP
jgi:hypothetical protein